MKSAWKFPFLAAIVMAGASIQAAQAQIVNATIGPRIGQDDVNTLQAYSSNSNYASPCPWVNTGWNTWQTGGGGGGQVWNMTWANTAGAAYTNSLAALSITQYDNNGNALTAVTGGNVGGAGTGGGWVVSRPQTNLGAGNFYPAIAGPIDGGGQVVTVNYAPTAAQILAGAPTAASVMFLQAYSVTSNMPITVGPTTWNGANSQLLDNGALPWNTTRNQATPWYAAGTLAGQPAGTVAMADAPTIVEPETSFNDVDGVFTYNDQFQTFIATDTVTVVGPVTTNNVTIYGGVSWGFNFTSMDSPEPSIICFPGAALIGLLAFRRRRKAGRAAKSGE